MLLLVALFAFGPLQVPLLTPQRKQKQGSMKAPTKVK
jgi:hypothetical protein